MNDRARKEEALRQLEAARADFYRLLGELSEVDFRRQSLNPGWTNGEIIAHITFGFFIINVLLPMARLWGRLPRGSSRGFAWLLNALTRPFHWINALGARGQGKVFTRRRVGAIYDRVHRSLVRTVDMIGDEEWDRGMYYPTRWDSNFEEFMTLEKLSQYPVTHFYFHRAQIAFE